MKKSRIVLSFAGVFTLAAVTLGAFPIRRLPDGAYAVTTVCYGQLLSGDLILDGGCVETVQETQRYGLDIKDRGERILFTTKGGIL